MPRPGNSRRMRRQRKHAVIGLLKIYGPVCQICDQPIDLALSPEHPMGLTIDHVIPLNRGGSNHFANLQLAHRLCNQRKGDALPGEPMPVLGGVLLRTGGHVSIDRHRSENYPCYRCGEDEQPRTLVTVGRYTCFMFAGTRIGEAIRRPLCTPCAIAVRPKPIASEEPPPP